MHLSNMDRTKQYKFRNDAGTKGKPDDVASRAGYGIDLDEKCKQLNAMRAQMNQQQMHLHRQNVPQPPIQYQQTPHRHEHERKAALPANFNANKIGIMRYESSQRENCLNQQALYKIQDSHAFQVVQKISNDYKNIAGNNNANYMEPIYSKRDNSAKCYDEKYALRPRDAVNPSMLTKVYIDRKECADPQYKDCQLIAECKPKNLAAAPIKQTSNNIKNQYYQQYGRPQEIAKHTQQMQPNNNHLNVISPQGIAVQMFRAQQLEQCGNQVDRPCHHGQQNYMPPRGMQKETAYAQSTLPKTMEDINMHKNHQQFVGSNNFQPSGSNVLPQMSAAVDSKMPNKYNPSAMPCDLGQRVQQHSTKTFKSNAKVMEQQHISAAAREKAVAMRTLNENRSKPANINPATHISPTAMNAAVLTQKKLEQLAQQNLQQNQAYYMQKEARKRYLFEQAHSRHIEPSQQAIPKQLISDPRSFGESSRAQKELQKMQTNLAQPHITPNVYPVNATAETKNMNNFTQNQILFAVKTEPMYGNKLAHNAHNELVAVKANPAPINKQQIEQSCANDQNGLSAIATAANGQLNCVPSMQPISSPSSNEDYSGPEYRERVSRTKHLVNYQQDFSDEFRQYKYAQMEQRDGLLKEQANENEQHAVDDLEFVEEVEPADGKSIMDAADEGKQSRNNSGIYDRNDVAVAEKSTNKDNDNQPNAHTYMPDNAVVENQYITSTKANPNDAMKMNFHIDTCGTFDQLVLGEEMPYVRCYQIQCPACQIKINIGICLEQLLKEKCAISCRCAHHADPPVK